MARRKAGDGSAGSRTADKGLAMASGVGLIETCVRAGMRDRLHDRAFTGDTNSLELQSGSIIHGNIVV
jgi:hypothetical protein